MLRQIMKPWKTCAKYCHFDWEKTNWFYKNPKIMMIQQLWPDEILLLNRREEPNADEWQTHLVEGTTWRSWWNNLARLFKQQLTYFHQNWIKEWKLGRYFKLKWCQILHRLQKRNISKTHGEITSRYIRKCWLVGKKKKMQLFPTFFS